MLDDHEQLLQFDGYLDYWREDNDEGSLLLTRDELCERVLDHFRVVEKPVEVVQKQQRRAFVIRESRQRTKNCDRIASTRIAACVRGCSRKTQAAGNVPNGDAPLLLTCLLDNFAFSFIRLESLYPQAG